MIVVYGVMKKYIWLAIVGVMVLCIGICYYMYWFWGWSLSDEGKLTIKFDRSEYSEYIESARRLDVLTRTYMEAPKIINANWKKIPD